jgi:hypothetical protein
VQQQLREAEGEDGHLATWLAGQHSMQETAAEIDRLLQVCFCLFSQMCIYVLSCAQQRASELRLFLTESSRCLYRTLLPADGGCSGCHGRRLCAVPHVQRDGAPGQV